MFSVQLAKDYKITTDITLNFFTGEFTECIIGKKDLKIVLPKYLKKWGWNKSVDEFLKYWFKSEHKINQELIDYIQNLKIKGIKCYLATNQEKYRTDYMLNNMKFYNIFNKVYSSAHLGFKKPDLNFWEKILLDLKEFKKNEILFWDNSQINIESAKQFGLNAELYLNFNDFKKKMFKYF